MRTMRSVLPHSRAALTSLCVVTWVGLLVVGWWPFNFIPRNRVMWLPEGRGVHFDRYGQVFSPAPPSPKKYSGSLSIEIWLRSSQRSFDYSEIACFGGNQGRGLVVAQSGPDLVVEGSFSGSGGSSKNRRIFVPRAFADGSDHFVTITSDDDRTVVYLDATLQRLLPPLRVEDVLDGLLVGHSPDLNDPWSGDLLGLGVYGRVLTSQEVARHRDLWRAGKAALLVSKDAVDLYPLDEGRGVVIHNRAGSRADLVIPSRFYRQGHTFLEHSLPLDRPQLEDIFVNIAGFVPFSFLVALWAASVRRMPRHRCVLLAMAVGALTSLLIEMLQIYLPTRDSSLIDVIGNSFGSACGALAWFALSGYFIRSAARRSTFPVPATGSPAYAVERRKSLG